MRLRQQHLQDHWQLFGLLALGNAPLLQPNLKRDELFSEKGRVDIGQRRTRREGSWRLVGQKRRLGWQRVEPPLFVLEERWQLREAHVDGKVPAVPQRMVVRLGQSRDGDGRAVVEAHDALGEQEAAKEGRHDEIMPEQLLEKLSREGIPRNGVGDGGKDPGQLAEGGAPVVELARDALEHVEVEVGLERVSQEEKSEGNLNGGSEAAGKEVGGKVGIHGERLVAQTGAQLDRVQGGRRGLGRRGGARRGRRRLARQFSISRKTKLGHLVHNIPRGRAVPHVDGGRSQPGDHVGEGDGNILRVLLVEEPELTTGRGFGHSVAIVIKKDPFALGILARAGTKLFGIFDRRVEVLFIAGFGGGRKRFKLMLEVLANPLHGLVLGQGIRIYPALELGAGVCLDHVGRVVANAQAHDKYGTGGPNPVAVAPVYEGVGRGGRGGFGLASAVVAGICPVEKVVVLQRLHIGSPRSGSIAGQESLHLGVTHLEILFRRVGFPKAVAHFRVDIMATQPPSAAATGARQGKGSG